MRLDYTNMLSSALNGRGIHEEDLAVFASRFGEIHEDVERRRATGEYGFFELPYERETLGEIRRFAEGVGQSFDTIVVLGIGGSALGALALQQALRPPHWNELSDEQRDYFPKLYVLDNVDPATIGPFLDRIDLSRALFNVVSKSGATAETMAQYLIVRERLQQQFDSDGLRGHLLFTTDPQKGVLREIATAEDIPTLPVPPNVGGRFSVLSAVGLLPAALIGIDVEKLLDGAAAIDERCRNSSLLDNSAGLFAALQYLAHTRTGANIHVMMPYSDRLYLTADWFRQLWAESLGKQKSRTGKDIFTGPTPVKALGATDQHSQVQLYMEGPFDKTITFLTSSSVGTDVSIPSIHRELPSISYLGGHTLGELLDAERIATADALARSGRMNMTIELPRIDEYAIGQLFMMLEIATVYAGGMYDVDPLDQPGVELAKQLTYGLMGREGYTAPEISTASRRIIE